MRRHRKGFPEREKTVIIAILAVIGVLVYGVGIALRTNAGQQWLAPTVAIMPSDAPTLTATATLPPTATPTETPTWTPTETVTDAPSPTETAQPLPTETTSPTSEPPTPLPTETTAPTEVANLGTPAGTTMPGPATGPTEVPPVPTALPTDTPIPPTLIPAALTGKVTASSGLTLRNGPRKEAAALAIFLQGVNLEILTRSDDNAWVRVRYQGQEGWVSTQYLELSGDINTVPTESAMALAAIPSGQRCVSVIGDSLAFGEVLFEMTGVGFLKIKMAPFSAYVTEQIALRGIKDIQVNDRSYPGIGISSPQHKSYYETPAYNDLLRDRCKYTIVLPWVNDMSSGLDPAFSSEDHTRKLADMARRLVSNNPRGRILIGNYYPGAPAGFSKAMAFGFTPQAIQLFNEQMDRSCKTGELSQIPQVMCINTNDAFANIGTAYVVGAMHWAEIQSLTQRPLTPEEDKMLNYYLSTQPNAPLTGDGIHLNAIGKQVLASYIVTAMLSLPELPNQ